MPEISVIMPVYNGGQFIKQAIDSVLNQSFTEFELIIINDGSTDNSRDIIFSYEDKRIVYIENIQNYGLTRALNIGLEHARGEYVARMDADDISLPDRLEMQLDFLKTNPKVALVGGWIKFFYLSHKETPDYENIWKCPGGSDLIKFLLIFGNQLAHSSIMFRKKIIDNVGAYDENYKRAQDYEFYTRVISKYRIDNIQSILVKYRVHGQAISGDMISKREQDHCARRITQNYISNYFDINQGQFEIFYKAVNNKKLKIFELLKFIFILRRVRDQYLRKEKPEIYLSGQIMNICAEKRNAAIKFYLKSIYRSAKTDT